MNDNITDELARALEAADVAMNTCMDHDYSDGTTHHQSYDSDLIGAAHLQVRRALISYRAQAEEPKWRDLEDGEAFERGDIFHFEMTKWLEYNEAAIGVTYLKGRHWPSRRPIRTEAR